MGPEPDILKVPILGKDSIHCGFHLTSYIVRTVVSTLASSTYVLVTDTNVARFHLEPFEREFQAIRAERQEGQPRFLSKIIAPGETSKSRVGKADIEDFLLLNKCTRDTVILALGGGVIGDLVGFAAATFMRGVRLVQIPTTLLAMVDSSVGGKTAIDTPQGKNLIGAFWQPEYIFIDPAFLETLPVREFSNGMAEVVKTAAIWSEKEFEALEFNSTEIFAALQTKSSPCPKNGTPSLSTAQYLLLSIIVGSISVKAHIVTVDERETGLRNLVNFGHSIGHAIEAVLTPTILHGECVSVGMILEAEIARQMGVLGQVAVGRLTKCLKSYDLPVSLADPRIASLPAAKLLTVNHLLDFMKVDKKNSGPEKKIVILSRIGATYEQKATVVKDHIIAKILAEAAKIIPGSPSHDPVIMTTPGSKSISNRALVLAALGKGTCKLQNLLHSDDTQVMMTALMELKGAKFTWEDRGETLVVHGGQGSLSPAAAGKEIYLGNAGTAARFITTVCTLIRAGAILPPTDTVITGNARMKQRPIAPLVDALRANGCNIEYLETPGCLPLSIAPSGLKGGLVRLAASVSSQYVSSILLCAPYATEPVTLELTGGQVISQPYIDMTIAMMKSFGVVVTRRMDSTSGTFMDVYDIPKGEYVNPSTYAIESDASSATYPLAIAAITGTTCTIQNIGSASLQGDARFAREVLQRMGCEVVQSEAETKVTGPPVGTLKAIGDIDMETMTDAFLTASVLAAVAAGRSDDRTTRIVGIGNQRVKECNRIKAMMDELAKFGVQTKELDDGLEISGRPIPELKEGVRVHCYDDHRVAMAFSVLGTAVKDTILEEKRCVEKTWPNWWDDLQNKIGLTVEGVDLSLVGSSDTRQDENTPPSPDPTRSVVLIGMRGAGKTFIGNLAATSLGWQSLDADQYFESKHPIGVREFVQQHGWPAFRAAETEILAELLETRSRKYVISLGGGIVETPAARELLKRYAERGPVVYVVRPLDEIVQYLADEGARPAFGEPIPDVYRRRQPWFLECCSFEFHNPNVGVPPTDTLDPKVLSAKLKATRNEVHRFFGHITGQKPNLAPNLTPGRRSYFLSLTYPDVKQALPQIEDLTAGADAIELRVDLLRSLQDYDTLEPSIPSAAYVADQVSALRSKTSLPIVFTVRTAAQGGAFPNDAEKEAFDLLRLALRLGAEYVDVEITWPEQLIAELSARKGSSMIIASYHDWSGNLAWDQRLVQEKYGLAHRLGDIVKLVGKANSIRDNFALFDFVSKVNAGQNAKPIIAINMGVEGQLSRILNSTFSPVSHPLLPSKAAPGQLSLAQIQNALHLIGQLPARRFYLFGNPIGRSMSPTMHNTGFEVLGLPHKYELLQTDAVGEEIRAAITAPDFGGASVTIPFKLDVIPLLDKLSPAAKAIGAVNTIIPRAIDPEGSIRILYGDNTDWLGIRECIQGKLPNAQTVGAALVIGAGGTARAAIYALHALGAAPIYLYNRTQAKAQTLVESFPDVGIVILDALDARTKGQPAPNVIVSTIPASATTTEEDAERTGDAVYLPSSLFNGEHAVEEGVLVDMAYQPNDTPLIALAKAAGKKSWAIVNGLEVLLEQGYVQFELWTERRCPREAVARRVHRKFHAE